MAVSGAGGAGLEGVGYAGVGGVAAASNQWADSEIPDAG